MERLLKLLLKEDAVEKKQHLNNGININDMGLKYGPGMIPKIPKNSFFNQSYVNATKQHRYSYMPAHTHSFIEFNYEFSGHSDQQLNGDEQILRAGQLLVMDTTLIQRYGYMDTNDLLVNVLLDLEKLPASFLSGIQRGSGFGKFIYNALDKHANHDNYLIYDLNKHPNAKEIWEELMYFTLTNAKPYETRSLLLKAALSCLPTPSVMHIKVANTKDDQITKILEFIDNHYVNVSLSQVSKKFGYNKNYLGNKIKQSTGMSFGQLLGRKRLLTAESMLLDTKWSINTIAEKIGYRNKSSLFHLFKDLQGMTPAEFRNQHKDELN